MHPQTFIFFGRSGSGKGTQAKFLIEALQKLDPQKRVLYLETGQKFRELSTEASYTAELTKEIIEAGGLLPEFLPIWVWTEYLVRHVAGNEHMILDGLSRRPHEAVILDSAMKFYKRENPFIISIEVSRDWAGQRLRNRGRNDDNKLDIEAKMDWYDNNVMKALEFFKKDSYYRFLSINGEQDMHDVHQEILTKIGLQ